MAGNNSYSTKDMRGVLFRNSRHEDGDNRPVLTGEATVEGKQFEIAAWPATSQKGTKYWRITFELPLKRGEEVEDDDDAKPVKSVKDDDELPW